jgi:DNA-binding SARP family transcriptional activator
LDVSAFTSLLSANQDHRHRRAETCKSCAGRHAQAVEFYRGDFLQQFSLKDSSIFESWALVQREKLRQHALESLYHLAHYAELRGIARELVVVCCTAPKLEPGGGCIAN